MHRWNIDRIIMVVCIVVLLPALALQAQAGNSDDKRENVAQASAPTPTDLGAAAAAQSEPPAAQQAPATVPNPVPGTIPAPAPAPVQNSAPVAAPAQTWRPGIHIGFSPDMGMLGAEFQKGRYGITVGFPGNIGFKIYPGEQGTGLFYMAHAMYFAGEDDETIDDIEYDSYRNFDAGLGFGYKWATSNNPLFQKSSSRS